ncbi:hypothetical protein HPP92_024394 [Vanilla planifolia]|uniref:F-box/LRR-repeat protein 12 n=1 Tax=Vanilla planifolia TaxID=51239 RepID=A0A835PP61_VANPL|nr:hypothetical protein HPP92_024394 [Vanilla planifolia]
MDLNMSSPHTNLPDDCLMNIFQKLRSSDDRNTFGLTCRRWFHIRNISRRSLVLHFSYDTITYQTCLIHLPTLLNRFPFLSSVTIAGCTELSDSAFAELKNLGANLLSLSLHCCSNITDDGLALVVMQCSHLQSLTLYRCTITDTGLATVADSCKSLGSLNISYCVNITDHGIAAVSSGCLLLNVLVMSFCRGISGTGLRGCSKSIEYLEAECCMFTTEGLSASVRAGGLKYLNLSSPRCSAKFDGTAIGLAVRLQFLNLRLCRFLSNDSVAVIARSCPLLEEWSLAVCHEVDAEGWETIGLNCFSLKILHVNRCRNLCDRGLHSLRDGCPRLQVLHT